MNHFVNEYEFTEDISEEAIGSFMRDKAGMDYKICLVFMLFSLVFAVVARDIIFLFLALALVLVSLLIIGLIKLTTYRTVKVEKDRKKVLYPDGNPTFRIEIDKGIHIKNGIKENNVAFSNIEKILDTRNLIVIILKGSLNIALSKTGFLEGSPEECLSYMAASTGKKVVRMKGR